MKQLKCSNRTVTILNIFTIEQLHIGSLRVVWSLSVSVSVKIDVRLIKSVLFFCISETAFIPFHKVYGYMFLNHLRLICNPRSKKPTSLHLSQTSFCDFFIYLEEKSMMY